MSYNKILSPCASWGANGVITNFNPYTVLENLLLFDIYILQTQRLREIPFLVNAFGVEGVKALLKSGFMKVYFNPTFILSAPPSERAYIQTTNSNTIIYSYNFGLAHLSNLRNIVSKEMADGLSVVSVKEKDKIKIKEGIAKSLLPFDENEGELTLKQIKLDLLTNTNMIKKSVLMACKKQLPQGLVFEDFNLIFEEIPGVGHYAITNLPNVANIDAQIVHKIIESGVLANAHLNLQFERMAKHKASFGIPETEIEVLDNRIQSLYMPSNPSNQTEAFHRVIKLSGLPDLSKLDLTSKFSLEHFLDIRNSPDCAEFRHWLSQTTEFSDEELQDKLQILKSKLAGFVNSNFGRSIRWATSTGLGLIPGGAVIGPAFGALDTFLTDKILPSRGPVAFLGSQYSSLF
jgi:hypothetical protein